VGLAPSESPGAGIAPGYRRLFCRDTIELKMTPRSNSAKLA
jgi:hypothetical protein